MESLDERSAPALFQAAKEHYLPSEQALAQIRDNPNCIPVALTTEHRLVWLDIGACPLMEWKFRYTIENLLQAAPNSACFSTDIDLLASEQADFSQGQTPAGFVFHMSKCGSTLMARILDQSPEHITLKEPTPLHERFWQYMTQDWQKPVEPSAENLRIIRNLIQAMGRPRLPQQRSYFVRVRSWVIAFADIIQRAFPDTPCLFMYREPVEVMASILSKPTTGLPRLKESGAAAFITGQDHGKLLHMESLEYFTSFYQAYLRSSLAMAEPTRYLNYQTLTPKHLPGILQDAFQFTPSEPVLARMCDQFNLYSKDDSGTTQFASDRQHKQRLVTPAMRAAADQHLQAYFAALEAHPRNLSNQTMPQRHRAPGDQTGPRHAY